MHFFSTQLIMLIITLDGYNTFHGLGIIAVTTSKTEIAKIIPRVKVTAVGKTNIMFLAPKEDAVDHEDLSEKNRNQLKSNQCSFNICYGKVW